MKNIFKIGIITMILIIIVQIENDFKNRDIFNIVAIKVNNNISSNLIQELEKIKLELIGENINNIDLDELKKILSKDIRIKKIEITKKKINEIVVHIEENENEYYIQYKNKLYTIAKNGEIFGNINEYERKKAPIIVINNEKEKKILLNILQKNLKKGFYTEISQMYIKNENEVVLILNDGSEIKTDETVKDVKYEIALDLYKALFKNTDAIITYMDLRFLDIIVKKKK